MDISYRYGNQDSSPSPRKHTINPYSETTEFVHFFMFHMSEIYFRLLLGLANDL